MSLPYEEKNILRARNLRKNATPQEKHLWYDFLASYQPRFQRQKPIGGFIADFYCHKAMLVVEIDGSQHYEEKEMERDAQRTHYLEQYGLCVLRIPNNEVMRNFSGVCEYIDVAVKQSLHR